MTNRPANIADALRAMARAAPDRIAMQIPVGSHRHGAGGFGALTYRELDTASEQIAAGFPRVGITAGTRVAVMVRPGAALFEIMFALFKAGAVPVLIDPGIDKRSLRNCLAEAAPQAFIGIALAHAARVMLGWARGSVRVNVMVGQHWWWRGHTLDAVRALGVAQTATPFIAAESSLAAILFTSGSTGLPKGVEYTHGNFIAQIAMLRDAFGIEPGEVNLPTFPPFALFDPGLGMTSVIPAMDPTRPARADPQRLLATIARFGCTSMFGSPALLDTLSRHAVAHGARAPTLRRVLSAGAPVRPDVIERTYQLLPDGAQIWTPYGATECLPVAVIEGREILSHARALTDTGAGICVGRAVAPNVVRVIAIDDAPIAHWRDVQELPAGEIGEITVRGPTVTRAYFRRDAATALAKIDDDGHVVHRMGDLGYYDAEGRLWYVGRKTHRVQTATGTMFTECIEGIFNAVPGVKRSALVGIGEPGAQTPVVCIETNASVTRDEWSALVTALQARASLFVITRTLTRFLRHAAFPVDIRHNAKIGRERLAVWAATRQGA